MTSPFHFTGTLFGPEDRKIQIEFEMSLVPSSLKLTLYLMDKYTSWALNSERFDFKARSCEEDLDSRRDWHTVNFLHILGDVFILEPLPMRGKTLEISIKASWGPCFAILRWGIKDAFLRVAVRPSPPYRSWVKDHLEPVTWQVAVTHSDRCLARYVTPKSVTHEASSSSTHPPKSGPPPAPRSSPKNFASAFCQASVIMIDGVSQTISNASRDFGVGPDLIHLETSMVVYRPVEYFHVPWPIVWVAVFDEFGAIRDTFWTMPTPVEFEVPVNQFPPEATHEINAPLAYDFPANLALPAHPRRPILIRPPPPMFPRPEPPVERPGYIPIPPGVRAVYTTQAVLLRSQPEMNHPRRLLAPAIRGGVAILGSLNVVDIAKRWAVRLDDAPEINPTI